MCGIVGYIGDQPAQDLLIDGLSRLEYRGYDSAGVAFLDHGEFQVARAAGKLSELARKLRDDRHAATIGIGHTRWATHGRPSETNAHPHQSRDVVLVHNGIIENYLEIKSHLISAGHQIVSETDTEVICHLIQDYLDQKLDFKSALRRTIVQLKGAFSLVIMHRADPDHIYIAKKGSPLVVGVKPGESFVASDIPALLSHTNEVIFLEDGELGILARSGISFEDFSGKTIQKSVRRIHWTAAQAEKGGYKHFMLKEIMEQPRVFSDTLLGRVNLNESAVHFDNETENLLADWAKHPDANLHIIACGTSYHSGLVGGYWLENLAGVSTRVELASEFRYRSPIISKSTLVVPISQSGETADTLASLTESKKLGAKILSICNVIEASIPRASDATLYTHAGPEIGVASTKAFVTQMAVLYLLALKISSLRQRILGADFTKRLAALVELPILMQSVLDQHEKIQKWTDKIYRKEHCYFLGRGVQFPIALEGALKLKEISYVHAEGYAGGEMKHGPIALIEEGIPVVAMLPPDGLAEKMLSNVEEVRARGAEIFAVTHGDLQNHQLENVFELPNTHLDLWPFLTIIPLQLLAYQVADTKGTDVDQPRNLAKSVTVE